VQFTLSGFLNNKSKVDTFMQLIAGCAFMNDNEAKLHFFAFKYQPPFSKQHHGWQFCDLIKEYVRQGIYDLPEWKVWIFLLYFKTYTCLIFFCWLFFLGVFE
jgi:hypothetical protein